MRSSSTMYLRDAVILVISVVLIRETSAGYEVCQKFGVEALSKVSDSQNLNLMKCSSNQSALILNYQRSIKNIEKSFEENFQNLKNRYKNNSEEFEKSKVGNFSNILDLPKFEKPKNDESNSHKILSQRILKISPPIDFRNLPGVSEACKNHSNYFIKSLESLDLWALKMQDSSAKFSSGILNGNLNQFGEFDQCLDVMAPENKFQGQYCLAYIQPVAPINDEYFESLRKLVQSYEMFKSEFDDPGHRVPRLSTINWGICIPSTCTKDNLELAIKYYLNDLGSDVGIDFKVRVEDQMCQIRDRMWISKIGWGAFLTGIFFSSIFVISILSTTYDVRSGSHQKDPWFCAFSLQRNIKWLLSLKRSNDDIKVAHGIRFVNSLLLLISHKCMAMMYNPYINRTESVIGFAKTFSVGSRSAAVFTDPFLLLSGLLTAYSWFGKIRKGKKINLFQELFGRYVRIIPSLAALILFCTFILPLMGSGPQFNLVVTHHSVICKKYWWRNLLLIHNWFGFENLCLTHTHHVAIDFQLFLISPIFIYLLWRWPRKGVLTIIFLCLMSTLARAYVTYTKNLSDFIYFGTSISQLFSTADNMYTLTTHRFAVYGMGLLLGYFLKSDQKFKFTKTQIKVGWFTSSSLLLVTLLGPARMTYIDYVYDPTHAAIYAALAPLGWCSLSVWTILLAETGYTNGLIKFLSSKIFLVTTKLSYALYLTQFPIYFFNVGVTRSAQHFGLFKTIGNFSEYFVIYLVSAMLAVFIEIPFNNIKKIMFGGRSVKEISPTRGSQ